MPQIAPRVAGWQRRLGGQAGPLGGVSAGSGESPNGTPLQVELLIDGLWTDITSYVMTRNGSGKVRITRGRQDEGNSVEPSHCTLQLNNRDGRFSPRNPGSPYYGKIGRNTQIRFSVPSGNDKSYRFWGEVASWPVHWDITGADIWVDLEAAGILRRLGQGASPIGSTMYLAGISPERAASTAAHWPCEDGTAATSIASSLGDTPMTITGTPSLARYDGFACSTSIPTMGDATFAGVVPTYPDTGELSVMFLLAVPAAGATDGQVLCSFSTTGSISRWEGYYGSADGGQLGLRCYDGGGTLVQDTGLSFISPGVNGLNVQARIVVFQFDADVDLSIVFEVVGEGGASGVGATAAGETFGLVTTVALAPDRGLTDTAMGHLIVSNTGYPTIYPDLNAYVPEQAGVRISRLASLFSVPFESIGTLASTEFMGTQLSATLLDLIGDAATADMGILYEQIGGLGLGYRTSGSLMNQAPVLTLSYSAAQLAEIPAPVDDDQHTRNDVIASRTGGSSYRATQSTGPLSVLPPPAGVGRYDSTVTVNVELDTDLPDQAGWRLHLGTVDEPRFPAVGINLAHPSFAANATLRQQALAVRPGDRIVITDPPAWLPADDISQLVIGFSETIDHFEHRITYTCVPERPYRVAELSSATTGRLDTGGSTLAVDAPAGSTALTVASSGIVWATSPSEFPVYARIGGERVTVTAVSGATSPQVFTVTALPHAHLAGAEVRLDQPMTLGL
ncbi:MAG: hypothetical protein HOZ81_20560 [Streptomyces sp.]|nr:hypothetical protein [Streptomyces sp.]NUS24417.1 hypothetical protein [Streptomyces sp.]